MLLNAQRIVLRNFTEADLDPLLAYRNVPEVARYQGWKLPYTRELGLQLINEMKDMHAPKQGNWLQLAIEFKETGEMIGDVGMKIHESDARQAVIGFTVAPAYWRKGIATEAIGCLLGFLFEDLDLHRVTADCDADNAASWRTLERLGFRREAYFVESFLIDGVYTSEYHYGMLQREWRARNA